MILKKPSLGPRPSGKEALRKPDVEHPRSLRRDVSSGDHRFDQSVGARVVVFDAGAHMPELQVAQMTQRVGRLLMDFPRPLVQAGTTSAVRPSS